jgi:hypothetical protein
MLPLRFRFISVAIVVLGTLLASTSAYGDTIFIALLTNAQENPPTVPTLSGGAPRPTSIGVAEFLLNTAETSLRFTAAVANIDFTGSQTPDANDNLVAAHIHAGPAVTPTTNGPVVWGFFGAPFNDNNPNDMVITPFTNGLVGGTISGKWDAPEGNGTTLTAQLDNIKAGRAYINFHTTQFTGGEVRGAITGVNVPEPSSLLLVLTGTAGLLGVYRRRMLSR